MKILKVNGFIMLICKVILLPPRKRHGAAKLKFLDKQLQRFGVSNKFCVNLKIRQFPMISILETNLLYSGSYGKFIILHLESSYSVPIKACFIWYILR